MSNTTRIDHIDIAAGIMILWLLLYHALWPIYESEVLHTIPWFFYFMPWFFYKSGYFFAPKPLNVTIRKDASKLLKQYAIWSIIGFFFYIAELLMFGDGISFHTLFYKPLRNLIFIGAVPVDRSLWFLPVLFFVHLLATIFSRKVDLLWVGIICLIIAVALHFIHYDNMPRPIYATAWGLFFFSVGNKLSKIENNILVFLGAIAVLIVEFLVFTSLAYNILFIAADTFSTSDN